MKVKLTYLILFAVVLCIISSCNSQYKRQQKAQLLYEEGVRLRSERLSEEATKYFLEALSLVNEVETDGRASLQLRANIKDNLGAMYNKHQMFEDALLMHLSAIDDFKKMNDSVGMMTAWRNCGRAAKSLGWFPKTKEYYDNAFQIAKLLRDDAMIATLYLETGRDYYMEIDDYETAIEYLQNAIDGGLQGNDLDIANMTLGILYYYIDENDKAKPYLERALQSDRAGVKMSVYQTLYGIALNEENLELAMENEQLFLKYMALAEKEHNNENIQRVKAESELAAQKNELDAIHRTKSLKLYLIIAAIFIVALVILLIIKRKIAQDRIKSLEKELQMRDKVMLSSRVFTTAKNLSEHLTADAFNFNLTDADWDDFISMTDLVFDGFSKRLLARFSKLTKNDVRICCLAKNGFSNQVIAVILETQLDSYYKRKMRIKQQKMELSEDTRTFEEIINAI
ncbi:MAG: hypothetical protein J5708_02175 [Bacteroidales bacterium]|nr:hypothetical protein [Bacteroidales bacterium]